MPTINASLVPTIPPGRLFDRFITDNSINVRWITPQDPVFYEVINRPMADIVLRQLILAKTLDQIDENMGYLAIFPFVTQPQVESASTNYNIPIRIFWDFHVSLPDKWSNLRLARVDRIDGDQGGSSTGDNYTGTIRFIFIANERTEGTDSSEETAIFYVDYEIDSTLTYQVARVVPADANSGITGFTNSLPVGESNTIGGTVVFATADADDVEISTFYDAVAPASGGAEYDVVSTTGADTGDDFSRSAISHGTGVLTSSAYNAITTLDSDPLNWVESFNYPFDLDADRESDDTAVTIPNGLFREFSLIAPAADLPTGDTSGTFYPVWISKMERSSDEITFYFSTYNITDNAPDTSTPIEFATLVVTRSMVGGQVVAIEQLTDLLLASGTAPQIALFTQHFGKGHVVLSKKWDLTGGSVDDLFDDLNEVPGTINSVTFGVSATRISSFGLCRVPKYIPTKGQSQALAGTAARRDTPVYPSDDNRYVTELDEGLGDQIDLESVSGITTHAAISRYGYAGTRVHQLVNLVIDQSKLPDTNSTFYDDEVLPRLTELLGRAPVFGDEWWNGTRFLKFNGDAWVG